MSIDSSAAQARENARQVDGGFGEQTLDDPAQINWDEPVDLIAGQGSFDYPPYMHTAEEVVRFWSRIEVPDEAMDALIEGYQKLLEDDATEYGWEFLEANKKSPKETDQQFRERKRAYIKERLDSDGFPDRIPKTWAREIVKAEKMWQSSQFLPEDEKLKIKNLKIRFTADRVSTVGAVRSFYRTGHIRAYTNNVVRKAQVVQAVEENEWAARRAAGIEDY